MVPYAENRNTQSENLFYFTFLEVDVLSSFELSEDIAGIKPLDDRYQAFQFSAEGKELIAEDLIKTEILRGITSDKEFFVAANIRHDRQKPSVIATLQTKASGKQKFTIWVNAFEQKLGIRSHSSEKKKGKKNITFKKLPIKIGQWHRIVIHFKKIDKDEPIIDLYVDCQFFDSKTFPFALAHALVEDGLDSEFRLGQLKNAPEKDPSRFIVSNMTFNPFKTMFRILSNI